MKIKTKQKSLSQVLNLKKLKRKKPKKPSIFFRTLARVLSSADLKKVNFKYTGKLDMKNGPYLVLMNHSSFIDLKIAYKILYPHPFSIVCTHDAMVGKSFLMHNLGCIPTKKFVADVGLIKDMKYMLKEKNTSVLMYPEAGYSFDGKATTLPDNFGRLIKILNVPVAFINAKGAFSRDPLYNGLRLRKVSVSAEVSCLITKEQVDSLSVEEISNIILNAFSFDNFRWQQLNRVRIDEEFRAEGLERILYRCANCGEEGKMSSSGAKLSCSNCGKSYVLTEYGEIQAENGETEFKHIPDWYEWQRSCVKEEILAGNYGFSVPVKISILCDYKALYDVGEGVLSHSINGFKLTGCDNQLSYVQPPLSSYGLNADYFWYEKGDVICIGDSERLYYCFTPPNVSVTKARLATEELYKLYRSNSLEVKNLIKKL